MKQMIPIPLDRMVYAPGQTLLSADFRDAIDVNRQLQYWHNRAMHGAYGMVVPLQPARPLLDDKLVVLPFFAYDGFGRPMLLNSRIELTIPEGKDFTGTMLLMARMGSAHGEAALEWHTGSPPPGVPIARIVYEQNGPSIDWTFSPPVCRPLGGQPKIVVGKSVGMNNWSVSPDRNFVATVDTSAAGFVNLPVYFAQLQLPGRAKEFSVGELQVGKFARTSLEVQISAWPMEGYLTGRGAAAMAQSFNTWSTRNELSICWMGIESRGVVAQSLEDEHESI